MDNTWTRVRFVAATCLILLFAGCGSGASATRVAEEANAESCTDSGYRIVYRTDNSKHTIWDCQIAGGTFCVAEENGIASDITDEARIVFANALNGNRPDCLS